MKKTIIFILLFSALFLFSCRTNLPLWKEVRHFETNSLDINGDSFLKIVFATYSDDSTYFLLVQDRIKKVNYSTQGQFRDTIKEYIFYPLPNYKVTINLFKKENPIGGINDTLFFRMNPVSKNYKKHNIPWTRLGYPFKCVGGRNKRQ